MKKRLWTNILTLFLYDVTVGEKFLVMSGQNAAMTYLNDSHACVWKKYFPGLVFFCEFLVTFFQRSLQFYSAVLRPVTLLSHITQQCNRYVITPDAASYWVVLVFNAARVILSRAQVLAPMVLKQRPTPMPVGIGYSLQRGRGGSLDCMWGVQTHSGPPVFLVSFHKDLARVNDTPQPSRKRLPLVGIKSGTLNHKSQPLTTGLFLTPYSEG